MYLDSSEWLNKFLVDFTSFDKEVPNSIEYKKKKEKLSAYYDESNIIYTDHYCETKVLIPSNINHWAEVWNDLCYPASFLKPFKEILGDDQIFEKILLYSSKINKQNIENNSSVVCGLLELGIQYKKNELSAEFIQKQLDLIVDYGVVLESISNYKSVELCTYNYFTFERYRLLICLHIARHLIAYDLLAKSGKYSELAKTYYSNENHDLKKTRVTYRNSGWSNARILILTTTRQHAKEWAKLIAKLSGCVEENEKILLEYSVVGNDDVIDEEYELGLNYLSTKSAKYKSLQYINMFRGNNIDKFILPMRLYNGKIKYHEKIDNANIIIASPIGLMLMKENIKKEKSFTDYSDEETTNNKNDHDKYLTKLLSSVEILIIDNYDHIEKQNITLLLKVLNLCNTRPTSYIKNLDISRLRPCYYQNDAQDLSISLRQNIFLCNGRKVELEAIQQLNMRGFVRFWKQTNQTIFNEIKQQFNNNILIHNAIETLTDNIPVNLLLFQNDRIYSTFYNHFVNKMHQHVVDDSILVVVPTIIEYYPISLMLKQGSTTASFKGITENTSRSKAQEIFRQLREGICKLVIITERFFYYNEIIIRGQKHIVFVQPPKSLLLFYELCKMTLEYIDKKQTEDGLNDAFCLIYWNYQSNLFELERLVGAANLTKVYEQRHINGIVMLT